MSARRVTKVVSRTTKPRSATKRAPLFAATHGDGALRALCVVARRLFGIHQTALLASRLPPLKPPVAPMRDLVRGALDAGEIAIQFVAIRKSLDFGEEWVQQPLPESRPQMATPGQFLRFAGAGARLSFADGGDSVPGRSAVVHHRHHRRVSGADVQRSQAQAALFRQGLFACRHATEKSGLISIAL